MFKSESARQQMYSHAAKGHETSMRQVLDEFHERLKALEAGGRASAPESEDLGQPGQIRMMNAEGTAAEWVDPPRAPGAPAEVSLDEKIAIAIRALPESGYGQSGKPNVAAIESALGENIAAADRDRVWAALQAAEEG